MSSPSAIYQEESQDSKSCLESEQGASAAIPNKEDQGAMPMASLDTDLGLPSGSHSVESKMLDTLMQRMKSDLMYELRHIQHGERPVTGQGHRDNLHQFMLKNSQGQHNVTANRDLVEEHRPEAVVVEVQGIIERRPVSSVLQSAAFRRQLENVIRGGLNNARQIHHTTSSATAGVGTSRHPRQRQSATNAALPRPTRRSPQPIQPEVVRPESVFTPNEEPIPAPSPLSRSESTESIDSFSSARSSAEQEIDDYDSEDTFEDFEAAHPAVRASREQTRPSSHTETRSLPRPRSTFINRVSQEPEPVAVPAAVSTPPQEERPRVNLTWQDINRVQREEMVQEISELLHSRLVSSTLESEFRATLELLAQDHVQSSGQNGQAVQEFIHTLPGRGIPHNDFSHMGIPAGAAGGEIDNWDNISVASVSAHSVPYVQTNTYLGREIQSLRAQMNEMKSLLKLTFDLQMDIQRSIRQEVAAALNNVAGSNQVRLPATAASRPVNDTHCLICLDRHSDTVLYQCGHMCVCNICGRDLIARGHTCPVCRAPIKDVIRAYKTNAE